MKQHFTGNLNQELLIHCMNISKISETSVTLIFASVWSTHTKNSYFYSSPWHLISRFTPLLQTQLLKLPLTLSLSILAQYCDISSPRHHGRSQPRVAWHHSGSGGKRSRSRWGIHTERGGQLWRLPAPPIGGLWIALPESSAVFLHCHGPPSPCT